MKRIRNRKFLEIHLGFYISVILIPIFYTILTAQYNNTSNYIRLNTLAYLKNDQKIALVGAKENLKGHNYYIIDANDIDKVVFKGIISADRGNKNTPFKYNFPCDFSNFKTEGQYRIKLDNNTISAPFIIGGSQEYKNALEMVLKFFRSQRCGNTDPLLHDPCHLNDTSNVIDVSGGWHNAGDYIKYMITATFTTVELLTAIDYAVTYNFDEAMGDTSPHDEIPDLLEEARIGLEWILKMTSDYSNDNYYYQVSGVEDHTGWRLPESDDNGRDYGKSRSLHKGWGGNLLGRSCAALAIASRQFKKYDDQFATKCLSRAKVIFAEHKQYEKVQKSNPDYFYNETEWMDDMVLGAAELYQSTSKNEYLKYAAKNIKNLTGDNISWNGSDYLAFAACVKANIEKNYCLKRMKDILSEKLLKINNDVYYLSSGYVWGTTAEFTADAQKAIMYYYLTSDTLFLNIATAQRDYLLGRNNWGISFVIGLGEEYPLNAHAQVNSLIDLQIGGIVGGPAEINSWKKVFPNLQIINDRFVRFQSNIVYHDNQEDYYTNEVALDYAAPSIFIFLYNIALSLNEKN